MVTAIAVEQQLTTGWPYATAQRAEHRPQADSYYPQAWAKA